MIRFVFLQKFIRFLRVNFGDQNHVQPKGQGNMQIIGQAIDRKRDDHIHVFLMGQIMKDPLFLRGDGVET